MDFVFVHVLSFIFIANTRVLGELGGIDQSTLTGTHPTILNLIKELEEHRQQTNPIPSEEISNDRFVNSSFFFLIGEQNFFSI